MYLLVVAAIIIDSCPLKYFWLSVGGYLVLRSGKILFPAPIYTSISLHPQRVFGLIDRLLIFFYRNCLNLVLLLWMGIVLLLTCKLFNS